MDAHPVAQWLKASRMSQINPATGKPWTMDHFLERLNAETGWGLDRPNYSRYETGKQQPKTDTLARFVAFWAAHGVAGPDLSIAPAPTGATESADPVAAAIDRQTAARSADAALQLEAMREANAIARERLEVDRAIAETLSRIALATNQLVAGQETMGGEIGRAIGVVASALTPLGNHDESDPAPQADAAR